MSNSMTYALSPRNLLLTHRYESVLMVADHASIQTDKLRAKVKSGDYFVTLATVLDLFCQQIDIDSRNVQPSDLEQSINELIYLQEHYKIVPKEKA